MICRHCGAEIPDDAAFCAECGQPVADDSAEEAPSAASTDAENVGTAGTDAEDTGAAGIDAVAEAGVAGAGAAGAAAADAAAADAGAAAQSGAEAATQRIQIPFDDAATRSIDEPFDESATRPLGDMYAQYPAGAQSPTDTSGIDTFTSVGMPEVGAAQQAPIDATMEMPIPPNYGQENGVRYQAARPINMPDNSKKSSKSSGREKVLIVVLIILIVAVLLLAFVIFNPFRFFTEEEESSTETEQVEATDNENSTSDRTQDSNASATTTTPETNDDATDNTTDDQANNPEGYLLPDSASRYYEKSELSDMSTYDLYLARNEIYARHGRGFNNQDLQDYFNSQSWYKQLYTAEEFDSMPDPLNDYEKKNADLIREIEEEKGSTYL